MHTEDVLASMQMDHTEITTVFKWLRDHQVEQVLELSVPDRLLCPHSDEDVAYCVNNSGVRVLKWRKLDLYLGNLTDRSNLQELHLFSSGNRAVYERWIDDLRERKSFPNVNQTAYHTTRKDLTDSDGIVKEATSLRCNGEWVTPDGAIVKLTFLMAIGRYAQKAGARSQRISPKGAEHAQCKS